MGAGRDDSAIATGQAIGINTTVKIVGMSVNENQGKMSLVVEEIMS
jgi:hypothetical protein